MRNLRLNNHKRNSAIGNRSKRLQLSTEMSDQHGDRDEDDTNDEDFNVK